MSKRDEFITIITAFRAASSTISDEQRKGLLRQAVHNYGLSVEEATEILQFLGLVVGREIDYFDVLGISIDAIHGLDENTIVGSVETAHKKLYRESLNAGGRPRPDGRTENEWRTLLNQARDTLIDAEKRNAYIASLKEDNPLDTEILSREIPTTPEQTPSLPTDSISDEEHSPTEPTTSLPLEKDGMVLIPAGNFQMGSEEFIAFNSEDPIHTVYLDSFYMDKYPVTNEEYKEFIDANPQWQKPAKWYARSQIRDAILKQFHDGDYLHDWKWEGYPPGKVDHPATWVSWYAAMAYSQWKGKRLPTEAEWEKAARGGLVGKKHPWGDALDMAFFDKIRNLNKTAPVGSYPANDYGLYDVIGNVFEWCLDKWDQDFYKNSPQKNPLSDGNISDLINNYKYIKETRVLRGGSWPKNERVAARFSCSPQYTSYNIGFRCVKPVSIDDYEKKNIEV